MFVDHYRPGKPLGPGSRDIVLTHLFDHFRASHAGDGSGQSGAQGNGRQYQMMHGLAKILKHADISYGWKELKLK